MAEVIKVSSIEGESCIACPACGHLIAVGTAIYRAKKNGSDTVTCRQCGEEVTIEE